MNSKFQSTKRIPPPPRIPIPPFKEMPLKYKLLLGVAVVGNVAFYSTIFTAALKLSFPFPH